MPNRVPKTVLQHLPIVFPLAGKTGELFRTPGSGLGTPTAGRLVVLLVALLIMCGLSSVGSAAERPRAINVQLRDGRQLVGYVDSRTDNGTLWLHVTRDRIQLSTGFTWDLVETVQAGRHAYTASEFREVATEWASAPPAIRIGSSSAAESRHRTVAGVTMPATRTGIEYLQVEAAVKNWDRDRELDGIEIVIIPRDSAGRVVPVSGGFSADLQGRRQVARERSSRSPFPNLESWSQTVRAADFRTSRGAVYQLPFRDFRPDQNLDMQSFGSLTVRLNAVSFGAFDASAPVRLRDFNPIRDQLLEYDLRRDSFDRYRGRHW